MFIDRGAKTLQAPFGGAEWFRSGEAPDEFRSSETELVLAFCAPPYEHLTLSRVKTEVLL